HYRYNSEHQLIEVRSEPKLKHQDTTVTTYRYDGLGRRISKSTTIAPDPFIPNAPSNEPRVTRFVWEGLRLLQEIPEYGLNKEKLYLYRDSGSYEPLARLDDNHQLYWYHTTPNGTPERLTDEAGEVRWQGVNNAWGKQVYQPMLTGGRVEQNLRMQGQYYDEESGLHYNLFRYYDPDSGRFTQLDPIG
ncbi:RHS repeat domain-containing protein, partial [Rosenbergiella epipactidis]